MVRVGRGCYFIGFLGALAGCGARYIASSASSDGGVTGTVSPDASTGSGGSAISPQPASPTTLAEVCNALCDRLARANCFRAECPSNCQNAVGSQTCPDAYLKFLTCALVPDFVCENGVAELANGACLAEKNAFYQCQTGQVQPSNPPADDAEPPPPPVDQDAGELVDSGTPTACPDIPPLPDTAICVVPESDSGPSDAEVWPRCLRTCDDGMGHEWRSECYGGKCVCSYGGTQPCTCPQRPYTCSQDCCF
jgi:hypothetical protein